MGLPAAIVILVVLLISSHTVASLVLDYQWWNEMGQSATWLNMMLFGVLPVAAAALVAFLVLWVAHARGLKLGGTRLREYPAYSKLATVALFLLGLILAAATIDTWAVVRFAGSRGMAQAVAWQDPVFGRPLAFYLFDLPFYSVLRRYVLAVALVAALVHWAAARFWQLRRSFPGPGDDGEISLSVLRLEGGLESRFLRGAAVIVLLALAAKVFLGRYEMLLNDHGFLVGVDYVDDKIRLPLQWLLVASLLFGAVALTFSRWKWLIALPAVYVLVAAIPAVVSAVYVRPNEISLQRPYLQRHLEATRAAYGLDRRVRESEFPARMEGRIDIARHRPLLDNVRLWDWRAFHDTVTQIQALRPYYAFPDSDVDRYIIDGKLRQVLLSPRELDIRQLPDARTRWINPHFIYTHGYGMVMAEANRITPDGMPQLFVQDAPARLKTSSLKLTRPEIYFGEMTHEPVYVRTGQKEFSYPAGNDSVFTRYEGTGGFPIASFGLRLAAAVREADWNILLTSLITPDSRMMIHRRVPDRLATLAGFVEWEDDPYLVLTAEGRLVWTVDGYTASNGHPYSNRVRVDGMGSVNYVRNSVKATVDAYSGETNLYVFDESDPVIQAYRGLFPKLLKPASAMPANLRSHARYPERFFRIQAEIYRTFHMKDPQAFYNKEDVWDLARNIYGQDSRPQPLAPTYVVATLPGEDEPEFLLVLPFTPRNKDNMIGLMVARCDGDKLGELHFLQLSKQALVFGPMQIEARINQDQNISKDLTLWNQQGSQVLRGQMVVLPVDDTFLYVEPIYIQASEARMPQLKKVVLAMGDVLIYRDTYEEALAELGGYKPQLVVAAPSPGQPAPAPAPAAGADSRISEIRQRLQKYRDLAAQGKWAEAGKELEAVERLANR